MWIALIFIAIFPNTVSMINSSLKIHRMSNLNDFLVNKFQLNGLGRLLLKSSSSKYYSEIGTLKVSFGTIVRPPIEISYQSPYMTLDFSFLCENPCFVVRSPTPQEYEFNTNMTFKHDIHDVNSEEIMYGKSKESKNKGRWNKFLGGRVALRRSLKFLKLDAPPILNNEFGAPTLPLHITGNCCTK